MDANCFFWELISYAYKAILQRAEKVFFCGFAICLVIYFILFADFGFKSSEISVILLPPEAQQTLVSIKQGGPFPFYHDGAIFYNREKRLPQCHQDYYREYTVPTPGIKGRGARRIIVGGDPPEVFYYSEDHYQTFCLISFQE